MISIIVLIKYSPAVIIALGMCAKNISYLVWSFRRSPDGPQA